MGNPGKSINFLLAGVQGAELGSMEFFETGTSTPKNVYTSADLSTGGTTSIELDLNGAISGSTVYFGSALYRIKIKDADDSVLYTKDGVNISLPLFIPTNASAYTDLEAAITAIGATETELQINESFDISSGDSDTVTVPVTMVLKISRSGSIAFDNANNTPGSTGNSLVIDGPLMARLWSVFDNADLGAVTFGNNAVTEVYPQWWDAKGDGSTDDAPAIQNSIDAATASGNNITLTSGTYIVDASQTIEVQQGTPTLKTALIMKSNVHFMGLGDVTIKIKDDISSAGTPINFVMFGAVTDVVNNSFRNMKFDMNGSNNQIADAADIAGGPPYGVQHHTAIFYAKANGAATGKVDELHIEDCEFTDTAGQNMIILGFANTGTIPLSQNVVIKNNKFTESGTNTGDHTTIYGWAENALYEGNTFTRPTSPSYALTHTAIEIHGKNSVARGNDIDDYAGGVLVATNNAGNVVYNVDVYDNDIEVRSIGLVTFTRSTATTTEIRDIYFRNNRVTINDEASFNSVKIGIQLVTATEGMENIYVIDNTIQKIVATTINSTGIDFGATTAGKSINNLYIKGNTVINTTFGLNTISAGAGAGDLGNIYIEDNTFDDLTTSVSTKRGIVFIINSGKTVDLLKITGNTTFDVRISNDTITTLFYDDTNILNSSGQGYAEVSTTITNRLGFYALDKVGSIATLDNNATPSVAQGRLFKTGGTTMITDFDDGAVGQVITVLSKHSVTFNTTAAQDADNNLDGSSANIVTASGDITVWLCEDGTTWHLMDFNDASKDNTGGHNLDI